MLAYTCTCTCTWLLYFNVDFQRVKFWVMTKHTSLYPWGLGLPHLHPRIRPPYPKRMKIYSRYSVHVHVHTRYADMHELRLYTCTVCTCIHAYTVHVHVRLSAVHISYSTMNFVCGFVAHWLTYNDYMYILLLETRRHWDDGYYATPTTSTPIQAQETSPTPSLR